MTTDTWWKTRNKLMAEISPNNFLKIPAGEEVHETFRTDDGKSIIYWSGYQKGNSMLNMETDTLASNADPIDR